MTTPDTHPDTAATRRREAAAMPPGTAASPASASMPLPAPAVETAREAALAGFFPRPTANGTVAPPSKTVAPPQPNLAGEPQNPGFYAQTAKSDTPLSDASCPRCGAGMTGDEAALNKKYIGRHVTDYLCPTCLGERLGLSVEELHRMIEVFRRQGCRLFSPLETCETGETRKP